MSQQDRHIIDIVANTKANLSLAGTLDEYQSGFSLDGFMGFRWVNDILQPNGGVHIFPAEETDTKFNRLGLFTGATGIEQLAPLTATSKLLGIDITGDYRNISYINEIGFNGAGDLVIDTCINTPCIYSSTDLTLEAKDKSVFVKTGGTGFFYLNNGTQNMLTVNQATGEVFNENLNTDLSSYADNQFVTADAIKAITVAGNPSFGLNGTLNVANGSQLWEARTASIQEDATNLNFSTTLDWFNLFGGNNISLQGAAQTLNITNSLIAPNLDTLAIESNPKSLVTYEYVDTNFGGSADDKVLVNSADSTSGFIGDLTPGDLTGKIQGGTGIGVTVDVTNPLDYKLIISNTAPAGDLQAVTDSGNLTTNAIIVNSGKASSPAIVINDGGYLLTETAFGGGKGGEIYISNDTDAVNLSNGGAHIAIKFGDYIDIKGAGGNPGSGAELSIGQGVTGLSRFSPGDGDRSIFGAVEDQARLYWIDGVSGDEFGMRADEFGTDLFGGSTELILNNTKATFNSRVEGLDPVDPQDFVTKTWGETNLGGGGSAGTIYADVTDTTLDYADQKLQAGTGITITLDNTTTPGDNKLIITATGEAVTDVDEVVQYVKAGGFNTQQIMEVESAFSNISGYLLPDPSEFTVTLLGGTVYGSIAFHDLAIIEPNFRGLLNVAQYDSLNTIQYTFSNLAAIPTGGTGGAIQTTGFSLFSADVLTQLEPIWTPTSIRYYLEANWEPAAPLPINTANGNVLFVEFDPVRWAFDDCVITLNLKIEKVI